MAKDILLESLWLRPSGSWNVSEIWNLRPFMFLKSKRRWLLSLAWLVKGRRICMCVHFGLIWIMSFRLVWIIGADTQQWGYFLPVYNQAFWESSILLIESWLLSDFCVYLSLRLIKKVWDKKDSELELPNSSVFNVIL